MLDWITGLILFGASLSKPHTSGTTLHTCVRVYVCLSVCLRPYTVKLMHKVFYEALNVLVYRVQHQQPEAKTTEVEARMAT